MEVSTSEPDVSAFAGMTGDEISTINEDERAPNLMGYV